MRFSSLISVADLAAHVDDPQWLVFDCRFDLANTAKGRDSYRLGHIPGAIYAHLDEDLSSPITPRSGRHPLPEPARLSGWLASHGFDGGQQVVVYDDSGGAMAVRLWWLLKALGHRDVALLDGGWQAWQQAGQAADTTQRSAAATDYRAAFNPELVVATEQVERNISARDFSLIDVRTHERYAGIAEPIDPVAGHIPGALNLPLTENLDADGFFKSAGQLRALYQPLSADCEPRELVFMCGSGVTACHSMLAMVHAGFDMPRLYAGSWSEWIRDPQHPVATEPAADA